VPVTQWLHLEAVGGDPWILPIWNAANVAVKAGRVQPLGHEFDEIGPYISTRLDIIPRIIQRINQEAFDIYKAAKQHGPEHIFTETKQGYAFRVKRDLVYCLIADIDALLFEVNSCWELMRKLFRLVRAHVGCPAEEVTEELRAVLGTGSDGWFRWLDRQRNFVAHQGTPYLTIDLTNDHMELLVMKENVTTFVDPNKFFRLSELAEVATGFVGVKQALQAHLIALFEQSSAQGSQTESSPP
jgi:hypothetical protein